MSVRSQDADRVKAWLSGLSDGYILHDDQDIFRKVQGPVMIAETSDADWNLFKSVGEPTAEPGASGAVLLQNRIDRFDVTKPYFVGENCLGEFKTAGGQGRMDMGRAGERAAQAHSPVRDS